MADCPRCGTPGFYRGLFQSECVNPKCELGVSPVRCSTCTDDGCPDPDCDRFDSDVCFKYTQSLLRKALMACWPYHPTWSLVLSTDPVLKKFESKFANSHTVYFYHSDGKDMFVTF
jgi:hypothetical protein